MEVGAEEIALHFMLRWMIGKNPVASVTAMTVIKSKKPIKMCFISAFTESTQRTA
jgi:hypothetical protein